MKLLEEKLQMKKKIEELQAQLKAETTSSEVSRKEHKKTTSPKNSKSILKNTYCIFLNVDLRSIPRKHFLQTIGNFETLK